jgi:hypothetical protein
VKIKPTTALLVLLDRINAAGCPVDYLYWQSQYASSYAEDADRNMPPFNLVQDGSGTPQNLHETTGVSPTVRGPHECLQYLFEATQRQMELCRYVEEKIKLPTREGLRIMKFMVTLAREMRQQHISAQSS